jgi:hypothetical protein
VLGILLIISGLVGIFLRKKIYAAISELEAERPNKLVPLVFFSPPFLGLMGAAFVTGGAVFLLGGVRT